MKNNNQITKKYDIVRTVSKSNRTIVETDMYMTVHFPALVQAFQ